MDGLGCFFTVHFAAAVARPLLIALVFERPHGVLIALVSFRRYIVERRGCAGQPSWHALVFAFEFIVSLSREHSHWM